MLLALLRPTSQRTSVGPRSSKALTSGNRTLFVARLIGVAANRRGELLPSLPRLEMMGARRPKSKGDCHGCCRNGASRHDQQAAVGVGRRDGPPVQARAGGMGRWLGTRVRAAVRDDGQVRHVHPPQSGQAPQLLSRSLASVGRGPRRGPDLHLLVEPGGCRADQQLGPAGEDARHAAGIVRRLHARPDHVCHSVQHGAARLADRQDRRADHR